MYRLWLPLTEEELHSLILCDASPQLVDVTVLQSCKPVDISPIVIDFLKTIATMDFVDNAASRMVLAFIESLRIPEDE